MKNKKILIISYYWPPFGGTGVYRILKFTKYLSQLGWEPIILTPKNVNARIVDENLLKEVPANTKVYYSDIFEPSIQKKGTNTNTTSGVYFQNKPKTLKGKIIRWIRLNIFVPDAKIGWYPYAIAKGKEIIKKEKPAIIFSTSPPPTTSLIANKLSKWSGLPWVADFRDPWTKIYYLENIGRTSFANKLNKRFEKKVHQQASAITVVNDGFFPHLKEYHEKTTRIINGFDRDDITHLETNTKKNEKFTIRYFGGYKLNQYYPSFVDALVEVNNTPELAKNCTIEFYGFADEKIKNDFTQNGLGNLVTFKEFIPRKEVMPLMQKSDLTLLFIGKEYTMGVSTKIFEYLMFEKKILAMGPLNGTANKIIEETQVGKMFMHNNKDGVYNFIVSSFSRWKEDKKNQQINKEAISNYDFKELTKKLASVFERAINNG